MHFFFSLIGRKAVSMKTFNARIAKRLVISLAGLAALGGCAVVPYNTGYYDQPVYGGPVYAAQPVYVAPAVNFGLSYRSRGYYGPRYYGGGGYRGRGRW
jgi:hypothetical protein